jgi:integrase
MNHRFQSQWGVQLAEFVRFKQASGQSYHRGIAALHSFDRFAAVDPWKRTQDFSAVLTGWVSQYSRRKPVTVANYVGTLRQFCLFQKRDHPDAFVPDRTWAPQTTGQPFLPYIFSPAELRQIVADTAHVRGTPRTRRCFRLLVLVLYCTGLRIGEALGLRRLDLDLHEDYFHVGPSKGRIRWVPFRRDLARELDRWLKEDCALRPANAYVFARDDGSRRRVKPTSQTLRFLFRRCGLKPAAGRVGPRCHDFRHTFAVHRLQLWYREGRDLHRMLPWLSAYLGHRNLLGTEHYLHATPELLAVAGRRLQRELRSASAS